MELSQKDRLGTPFMTGLRLDLGGCVRNRTCRCDSMLASVEIAHAICFCWLLMQVGVIVDIVFFVWQRRTISTGRGIMDAN